MTNTKPTFLLWLLLWMPLITGATQMTASEANATLPELIDNASEHFTDIETANLHSLLKRIGDSRLVLIGEASHGTAEFYDMRARITRELIEKKGFSIIAVEADWPDAAVMDHFIRGSDKPPRVSYKPFGDFPSWMWANQSISKFLYWLKEHNRQLDAADNAVGFYGLDLYNLFGSIEAVIDYLQDVDPWMAEVARLRYDCLMPWAADPSAYTDFMRSRRDRGCDIEVHAVWRDLCSRQAYYGQQDRDRYFNALQSARMTLIGEHYYRTKNQGVLNSWNLRDQSMFNTLLDVLDYRGRASKAVVWAHNSHIGDARATEMNAAGEINLGQRARETFGKNAYLIGFGTDHGTVAAASEWGGSMKIMPVPPAHKDSYGRLFHEAKTDNFLLPLRHPNQAIVRNKLLAPRLQRGIGTTYGPAPESEMKYHYSYASLPLQFDEYIWFDNTHAVKPIIKETVKDMPNLAR